MRKSVLDAIRSGEWNYEPDKVEENQFNSTSAMPGTDEKLSVMAERVKAGLPLWHREDRIDYEEHNET